MAWAYAEGAPSNVEGEILDRLWTDSRRQQMTSRGGERVERGMRIGLVEHQANARPERRQPGPALTNVDGNS